MYTDTILFLISGAFAAIALGFSAYLIFSRKRSKVYRDLLKQETELFDAVTTTLLQFKKNAPDSSVIDAHAFTGKSNVPNKGGTQRLFVDDATELIKINASDNEFPNFDVSALEGRYILEEEIHGGGMSRVFLARSSKLGNKWIVKFISSLSGQLANEDNILKRLNHISLPKIIDIFKDEKGVYMVESFIEGVTLDKVLETGQKLSQFVIMDWAEQLTQVLSYLHDLDPNPILHLDLKPSNIMVTHDNRLVLIDFGISKRHGIDDTATIAVTYKYAAPEQLKHRINEKHLPVIESRFGKLPADRIHWIPDARTDIYSLGVILFELATGQIPTVQNAKLLRDNCSHELYSVIKKCLGLYPDERYQSAQELLFDLQKIKSSKIKMARTLFIRKLTTVITTISLMVSLGSLSGGYHVYGIEKTAVLEVDPNIVTLSLQQSSYLKVIKQLLNGEDTMLEPEKLHWSFDKNDIAKVDGNRIVGINTGYTELTGKYRNKSITLKINVVEPIDGMVDIVQRFEHEHFVDVLAGSQLREHIDGHIQSAEFVSPESIDISEDNTIYITDAGLLRTIKDGRVESISFEPGFLKCRKVRCYKNDAYILTNEWEDNEGVYYGIIRVAEQGAEGLFMADAIYTAIEDFDFSEDGLIYFIHRNEGEGKTYLKTLNPDNTDDINILCVLPEGSKALALDDSGHIYIANPEMATIYVFQHGELKYFSGTENEKNFIDGSAPLFYSPQLIKYHKGILYVWDFNTLRYIEVSDGVAGNCMTLAGVASPEFDMDLPKGKQKAEDIIFPNSKLMDFEIRRDEVLLTDPKRGVIWLVE